MLCLMGCYETVPILSSAPREGAEIEARISDSGSASLTQRVGEGVETVRGHYQTSTTDTLVLRVSSVTRRNGHEDFWKGERLGLSRADIANLRERKLSRPRTAGVIAIGVLAASLVRLGFSGRTNTTGTHKPPPPPL